MQRVRTVASNVLELVGLTSVIAGVQLLAGTPIALIAGGWIAVAYGWAIQRGART